MAYFARHACTACYVVLSFVIHGTLLAEGTTFTTLPLLPGHCRAPAVDSNQNHVDKSFGVTSTGEALQWELNNQFSIPAGKKWSMFSCSWNYACGVTETGEGLCFGNAAQNAMAVPAGKTWLMISVKTAHSCGVTTSGEGLCWGSSGDGELSVPTGKVWVSITAGTSFSCGVTQTGEGHCWGKISNWAGMPSGKTWAMISCGEVNTCGVTTAGEGLCWGIGTNGENNVPSGKQWSMLQANGPATCGVTIQGEGLCWGYTGAYTGHTIPGGKTWAYISPGKAFPQYHSKTIGYSTALMF